MSEEATHNHVIPDSHLCDEEGGYIDRFDDKVKLSEDPFDTIDGGSDMTLKEAIWHSIGGVALFFTSMVVVTCLICH